MLLRTQGTCKQGCVHVFKQDNLSLRLRLSCLKTEEVPTRFELV
jgi:hypothetical protein